MQQRRPIKSRQARWAVSAARYLQHLGVTPNNISIASVFFAACGGGCFLFAFSFYTPLLLILAALFIQLRLICNLLDGMVAVEGGMRTLSGAVYNELPDRLADSFILIGVGYSLSQFSFSSALGWLAALLAVMTAYIRLLGASCGLAQQFSGPMAKQQRMALLTASAIIAAFIPPDLAQRLMFSTLVIIVVGSFLTCVRRTKKILTDLTQENNHD